MAHLGAAEVGVGALAQLLAEGEELGADIFRWGIAARPFRSGGEGKKERQRDPFGVKNPGAQ